jgi:hypothetical protein
VCAFAQTPPAPVAAAPRQAQAAIPASLSPGAAEVVRLATSGVGDEVVLAYIKNSQAAFNLSAEDVLYLKDIGLSSEVTSAMLNHDSALRGQAQQYAPAAAPAPAPAPAAAPAPAPAPAPTVAAAPTPVYVTAPPPDVAYFYNDLAPYGTWVQLDGYGWCWQPTTVVVTRDWRPYGHGGYWVYSDFGWYWQSTYSWGWAPFHYGRWYMHPRCGWVWTPDRVWGPAWVTWRTYGDTCGWAPLPPRAVFDVNLGWSHNGVSVGASFGFNLGSDAFLFVSFGNVCQPNVYRHCLPPPRAAAIYNQTTIINNYVVNNHRIEHRGIPVERVSGASHERVPRAAVRDWSDRPDRMPTRASSVVYRPRLEAPARPARMEAQRVDPQNPVIRHAPSGPARVERSSDSGRAAAAPRRTTLESPRVAPWTSAARPESSRPTQSARSDRTPQSLNWPPETRPTPSSRLQPTASTPQTTPATPSGRAPQTSTRSRETTPAPSPQVQPTPTRPQPVLTVPPPATTPRAPDNWKQGTRSAPGYRSDAGLPALGNARAAEQSSSAATPPANPHVYQPKSGRQAAELRPPSTPASSPAAAPYSREPRSDFRSRRDK